MTVANEGVPALGKIGIGGRSYTAEIAKIVRQTMPLLRSRPDQSNEPGEQAISYENVWPRSQHDWRLGSGQLYFDEDDGNRHRFRDSLGIDPWGQRSVTLLKDFATVLAAGLSLTVPSGLVNAAGGQLIYHFRETELRYALDPATAWFGPVTIAAPVRDMTATSAHYYLGTASGIYRQVLASVTAPSLFSAFALTDASNVNTIKAANGRLFASSGTRLVEIDSSGGYGAVGQLDFTHPLGNKWNCIAGAPNGVYAGSVLYGSDIYLLTVNPNTGGLVPTLAMTLPTGEYVTCMEPYGGVVILGTSRGFRLANISGDGALIYGPLVETYHGVASLLSRGENVYYGLGINRDGIGYEGVGRMNLSKFSEPLVPSYAADITRGPVTLGFALGASSIACTASGNVYMDFGTGIVYGAHTTDYTASGDFRTGQITYGTTEKKSPTAVDWRTAALPAGSSLAVALAVDGGAFTTVSTDSTTGSTGPSTPVAITGSNKGEDFELRFTLTRGTVVTTAPVLKRWTLRAMPTPPRVDVIQIPIILHGQVDPDLDMGGMDDPKNTLEEYLFLKGLETDGTVIDLVIGTRTDKVKIDQITTEPVQWNDNRDFFNCTLTLKLLTVTPLSEVP